jgi:uncharacterized protein (TIGR02001 family)
MSTSLYGLDYQTIGQACPFGSTQNCNSSTKNTRGSGYLDLTANYEIADKLTLNFHLGHQRVANYSNYSYNDFKIGLTKDLDSFIISGAVIGTDAKNAWWYAQSSGQLGTSNRTKIGETGVVFSISKLF